MNKTLHKTSARRLKMALIAFFALTLLSLFVVYALDPSIYLQTLQLTSSPVERFPWPATLFLTGLCAFLTMVCIGVLRHWRWTFWLLLIAFSASVLQFPAEFLQIFGVLPLNFPLWYSLFRLVIATLEVGLAIWMIRIYRREGVWAMGRNRRTP
jgi:hypothetical protein